MANTTTTERPGGSNKLVVIAALVVVAAGVRATAPVIVPVLLALFLALVASPLVARLRSMGAPVSLAIAIVTVALLGVGVLLSGIAAVSIGELSDSIPEYRARIEAMAASASNWIASLGLEFDQDDLRRIVDPGAAVGMAGRFLSELGAMLVNGALVAFLMILILFEASSVPAKLVAMTSEPERAQQTLDQLRAQVDAYFGVLTLMSAITGVLVFVFLTLLGVDLAVLWGLLAFLLNFIPNVGSIIAAVPAVILALVQLGPGSAGLVMLGYLAVNTVIGNVIQPRVMGRDVGLSTLTVFVSLLFWGWLLGPVGMLVSVPLTSAIRLGLEGNESTRAIAIVLGTEETARHIAKQRAAQDSPA